MRGIWGVKAGIGRAPAASMVALVAALALSGCSSLDDAMFGGTSDAGSGVPSDSAAPGELSPPVVTAPAPAPAPSYESASTTAGSLPPVDSSQPAYSPAPAPAYSPAPSYASSSTDQAGQPGTLPPVADYGPPAPVTQNQTQASSGVSITPITIEPGNDTGTAVSQTVGQLRGQLVAIGQRLAANAQRLGDVRNANSTSATTYQESKAQIMTRLQLGTTRGNPELVGQWNTAQSALDQLSANINALNAVGTDVTTDSSSAHFVLDQIVATFNVSGAVDEDHRQLAVLEDETNQSIILIDRLLKSVADDIQRQTAYVANERANLTTLANGIKNGELYGAALSPMNMPRVARNSASYAGGGAIAVVRVSGGGNFQQPLYASLNQALAARPGSTFEIVAVSPTRGTSNAVQIAQTTAKRRAQEVLRAMTDMGVPASRLQISASTDPGLAAGEVRVYQR